MTCAEREPELALLVSEDLDEPAATALRRHLDGCADCRARLDEFRGGLVWLRGRRHAPDAARLGHQLQVRLAATVPRRAPVPWPFALVRKLLDVLPIRLHHESFVASLAALLLVVGAVGALQRPLDGPHLQTTAATAPAAAATGTHRHDHQALEAELAAEEANLEASLDGEPDSEGVREAEGAGESGERTALASGNGLRIELQTRDPDVRIIWFAGATTP